MSRAIEDNSNERKVSFLRVVLPVTFVSALVALLTIIASQWVISTVPPQGQWWSAVTIPIALFTILVPLLGYGIRRYATLLRLSQRGLNEIRRTEERYREIIPAIIGSQYTFETGNESLRLMQTLKKLYGDSDDPKDVSPLLRQISTVAWRYGQEELCYDIRKLAYDNAPEDSLNRTYLASILPEVGKGSESAILKLVSDIDEQDYDAVLMGGSALGKYYMSDGAFDKAVNACEKPAMQQWNQTSMRSYGLSLACLNRTQELRTTLTSWESKPGSSDLRMKSKSQLLFICMLKAFLDSVQVSQFWEQLHPGLLLDAPRTKNYYNRTSCFKVFTSLKQHMDSECLDVYLVFYWLYGVKDTDADSELCMKGTWHRLVSSASQGGRGE